MLIAWPVFGEALSRLGFMGLFITAGGFGQNYHLAKTAFRAAQLVMIA